MILEIANFGRRQLASLLAELNFKTAVEIGVAEGWYSKVIMEKNPQLKLYGVDPWTPYRGYSDYTRTSTFDRLEAEAHHQLDPYPNYTFLKEFSTDALKRFEDNTVDFVYLDGNHAEPYISEDIRGWYKKVRPGGILAGHDYTRTRAHRNDTRQAVQKFAKEQNKIVFVLGTDTIREDEVRDRPRSWLILK